MLSFSPIAETVVPEWATCKGLGCEDCDDTGKKLVILCSVSRNCKVCGQFVDAGVYHSHRLIR